MIREPSTSDNRNFAAWVLIHRCDKWIRDKRPEHIPVCPKLLKLLFDRPLEKSDGISVQVPVRPLMRKLEEQFNLTKHIKDPSHGIL